MKALGGRCIECDTLGTAYVVGLHGDHERRICRECVEKYIRGLQKSLEIEDQAHARTLEERDEYEDRITELARMTGCEEEWSNRHSHWVCVKEWIEDQLAIERLSTSD